MYDISPIYIYYAPLAPRRRRRRRPTWNTYIPGSVSLPSIFLPLIHLGAGDPDEARAAVERAARRSGGEQPRVANRRFHARSINGQRASERGRAEGDDGGGGGGGEGKNG